MIRSMTAFTKHDIKHHWGNASWELRSVNQRYLEIYIRLPEQFRSLEPIIRERINLHIYRGKVECKLHFEVNQNMKYSLILNKKLAEQLIEAAQWIKTKSDNEGKIDPLKILGWPGVISAIDQDIDKISIELLSELDVTIINFINAREKEGELLKILIEKRLASVRAEINNIRNLIPLILKWHRERLLNKLEELQIHLDSSRLEQELLMLIQRIDVAEELDRLDTHVKETYQTLTKKEAIGRRLDFIMQEFNREANTIAAKSINAGMTASTIELKVLIEQMREQIQNIE